MKSRRQNVLENRLTNIPIDLIIEILSRLPAKSIAICRCVSKLWTSILLSSDFTEVFLTKSSVRPQLLFVCNNNGELLFFSATQPQKPVEKSFPLAASYHMKIPSDISHDIYSPNRGLVFVRNELNFQGRRRICNPSTRQFLTLPNVSTTKSWISSYFGYDPVEKQYKILAMTTASGELSHEHQILSLGTGELSWRKIECCIPHCPLDKGICINGVLYYTAEVDMNSLVSMMICFDVRSEKFRSIKVMETFTEALMINYKEDAEKEEWSEHSYVLSALCRKTFQNNLFLCFVGVTRSNEVVLSSIYQNQTGPFYIFYYSLERGTVVRVEIQGMKVFRGSNVHTYLDHVEDVKLMQMF